MNFSFEVVRHRRQNVGITHQAAPNRIQQPVIEAKTIRVVTRYIRSARGQDIGNAGGPTQAVTDRPGWDDEVGVVDVVGPSPSQAMSQHQTAHHVRSHFARVAELLAEAKTGCAMNLNTVDDLA